MDEEVFYITGVYAIRNRLNGKVYVGSAARSLRLRSKEHWNALKRNDHFNRHLQRAWNKYGYLQFVFTILERCSPEDCVPREQFWIDKLQAYDERYGYNSRPAAGTNIGVKWSEEIRLKMSEAAKRRLERPGELERLQEIGRSAPRPKVVKGRTHTPETRARIAAKLRGIRRSPETLAKMSVANKGKVLSPEQCQKMANTMRGRKASEETKAKMSASQKKRMQDPEQKAQILAAGAERWNRYKLAKQSQGDAIGK